MKILVCIKQIPDTNDVRWTKDNNILREGLISILNPYDVFGILTAKKIKEKIKEKSDVEITLLSMGPKSAENAIRYGIALGADRGVLLSDKKFSGADTLATAKTLAAGIKKIGFDLIITGQFALDGDTAQTPYSLSNLLDIPIIGYVNSIDKIEENEIEVTSTKDNGIYRIRGEMPLLIAVTKFEGEIYKPLAADYIKAQNAEIQTLLANDIEINPDETGIKGSPTYVSKAFRPQNKRECKFIQKDELLSEVKNWKF